MNNALPVYTVRGKADGQVLIIVEKADGNYSAHSPDLSGRIATGDTGVDTKMRIRESVALRR